MRRRRCIVSVLFALLTISFSHRTQAMRLSPDFWGEFCAEAQSFERGVPPPGTLFPLIYYLTIQEGASSADPPSPLRYAGLLIINEETDEEGTVQYAVHFFQPDGSDWPEPDENTDPFAWRNATALLSRKFGQTYHAECEGNYYCATCQRAPSHSWNAVRLFMWDLATSGTLLGQIILAMGALPDFSFVPHFAWNKETRQFECANLQPGMMEMDTFDLYSSPVPGEQSLPRTPFLIHTR